MKTSEFIKKIKELGYGIKVNTACFTVYDGELIIAKVDDSAINVLDTDWGEDIPIELFDALVNYAKTPIEERKEDKKYYLKLPFQQENSFGYLNYDKETKEYRFLNNDETIYFKTQFTQKEIDELPNQDFIRMLIKEEVECQI